MAEAQTPQHQDEGGYLRCRSCRSPEDTPLPYADAITALLPYLSNDPLESAGDGREETLRATLDQTKEALRNLHVALGDTLRDAVEAHEERIAAQRKLRVVEAGLRGWSAHAPTSAASANSTTKTDAAVLDYMIAELQAGRIPDADRALLTLLGSVDRDELGGVGTQAAIPPPRDTTKTEEPSPTSALQLTEATNRAMRRAAFTEEFYATRCEELLAWAKRTGNIDPVANILANGTESVETPPTYGRLLEESKMTEAAFLHLEAGDVLYLLNNMPRGQDPKEEAIASKIQKKLTRLGRVLLRVERGE